MGVAVAVAVARSVSREVMVLLRGRAHCRDAVESLCQRMIRVRLNLADAMAESSFIVGITHLVMFLIARQAI